MKQPPFLKQGDKVALVSTARKISELEIEYAVGTLNSWGLDVVFGKHLFKEHHQFAGTDTMRAFDFQQALNDESIKSIICVRGGYGTVRMVYKIDFSSLKTHPKWIVGYSDVTVLHSHISRNYGVPTIHATMPINFATNTKQALDSLQNSLFGEKITYKVKSHILNRNGVAEGEIIGGNLSILYSLIGSDSDIDTSNKILFIEDLDEYLYHIDRMMQNLIRTGKLAKLAGLVVGAMSDMNDNAIPFGQTAEEIIAEAVSKYDYPVCFNFPVGHIADNRALYVTKKAALNVGEKVLLNY